MIYFNKKISANHIVCIGKLPGFLKEIWITNTYLTLEYNQEIKRITIRYIKEKENIKLISLKLAFVSKKAFKIRLIWSFWKCSLNCHFHSCLICIT